MKSLAESTSDTYQIYPPKTRKITPVVNSKFPRFSHQKLLPIHRPSVAAPLRRVR